MTDNLTPEKKRSNRQLPESYKVKFLETLQKLYGLISLSCKAIDIDYGVYTRWMKNDPEFAQKAKEVQDYWGDFVESKLMKAIEDGNVTAIIYYCKTKLRSRGYAEYPHTSIDIGDKNIEVVIQNKIIDE